MVTVKVIGFDQATKITAYSVWDNDELVKYGTIESDKKEKNIIERMKQISEGIICLLNECCPDYIVIEAVQYQSNQLVYSQLSQLQGVLFQIFFESDIGFAIVEPSAWRKFSSIKGRKRDDQKLAAIQKVKEIYCIDVSDDIAESILIGLWAVNNIKGE